MKHNTLKLYTVCNAESIEFIHILRFILFTKSKCNNIIYIYITGKGQTTVLAFSTQTHTQSQTHPCSATLPQAKGDLLFGQLIDDGWVLWLCWVKCGSLRLSSQLLSITELLAA